MKRYIILLFCAACMCCVATNSVQAAAKTWNQTTGAGDQTDDLNTSGNWTPSGVPANGDTTILLWSRTTGANNKIKTITNAATATFFADSMSITNNSSRDDSFINISGTTFLTNGVGLLFFGGAQNSMKIGLNFSNSLSFNTLVFQGSGGSGNATMRLVGTTSGSNFTFNGTAGDNDLILTGPLGLSGTLLATNANANNSLIISGNSTVARLLFNNTAGNGLFLITNSTMTITGNVASVASGFTLANNGTLSLGGTGGLILSNTVPTLNGNILVNASSLVGSNGWANNGTVTLGGGTISGATFTNNASANISGFGAISNALVNSGTVTATNGELRLTSSASGAGIYRAVGGGAGGILTVAGNATVSALSNTAGGTVRVEGTLTNSSAFVNNGTLQLAGGTYQSTANVTNLAGSFVGDFGKLDALLVNLGKLTATNGTLSLTKAPVQSGTVEVALGGTLNVAVGWSNNGTVNMKGGTMAGGAVTNASTSGGISGFGTISNLVVNFDGLTATNGTLTLALAPVQSGTTTVANASSLVVQQSWTNLTSGLVKMAGGTIGGSPFANLGKVTGEGTISPSFLNSGTTTVTGAGITFSQAVTNSGTMTVSSSGAMFSDRFVGSGTLTLLQSTNTFVNDMVLTSTAVLSANSGSTLRFQTNSDFLISSTNANAANLLLATVIFEGGGIHTNAVTGLDLGAVDGGFSIPNFAYGTLSLNSASDLIVFADGDGNGANTNALYIASLDLLGDTNLVANLRSSFNIYYKATSEQPSNAYLLDQTYPLTGGGLLMPVVPEPSPAVLLLAGLILFRVLRPARTTRK